MLDHALAYARHGLPVFPCHPSPEPKVGKQPLVPREKGTDGQSIPKSGGLYKATTDESTIRAWWSRWPEALIGVRTGPEAGVFAVDPDAPKEVEAPDGVAAWRALVAGWGGIPPTHAHVTPSGGLHVLFRYPEGRAITNSPGALPAGIDVRGAGGYVIAAPSRLLNGQEYRLEEPEHAFTFADAPQALLDLIARKPERQAEAEPRAKPNDHDGAGQRRAPGGGRRERYAEKALTAEIATVAGATSGGRNTALNRAAFNLGQIVGAGLLDAGRVTRSLLAAAAECGLLQEDGQHRVLATIESGLTAGAAQPREVPDDERLSALHRKSERASRAGDGRGPGAGSGGPGTGEETAAAGAPSRRVIQVVAAEMPRVLDETEAAILAAGLPIYVRGDALVRPIWDEAPATRGRTTTVARFRHLCRDSAPDILSRAMIYQRFNLRREEWTNIDPPASVVGALLTRDGEWSLPPIAGVITTPTLRPDGSLLTAPGYDPTTRLYLVPDPKLRLPPIAENPTRAEAEAVLGLLLGLLVGFPFVGRVDRAVALSGILTAATRGAVSVAPLHAYRASTPGSGKSHLVDVAAAIATGRACPVIAAAKSEEENEKRLGALLHAGVPIISLDNVNGDLGGDTLCQMTERPLVRARLLGRSEVPEVENRATVFATGNGLTLVADMTRRAVTCTLDAGVERPEWRRFDFDPVERVLADRGAYVAAALTVVRAYRAAGSPEVCPALGSYGEWSAAVRAPLVWLGEADPTASMETARNEDPELVAIRELFGHWRDLFAVPSLYTTNAVIQTACAREGFGSYGGAEWKLPEFRDLLLRQAGDGGAVSSKRLGKWLSKISARVVDGYRLEMKSDPKNGNRYSLTRVQTSDADDASDTPEPRTRF